VIASIISASAGVSGGAVVLAEGGIVAGGGGGDSELSAVAVVASSESVPLHAVISERAIRHVANRGACTAWTVSIGATNFRQVDILVTGG